jgi:hypothetical protein
VVPAVPEQSESAGMQHLEKSGWDALIRLSNAIMYFIVFNVNAVVRVTFIELFVCEGLDDAYQVIVAVAVVR